MARAPLAADCRFAMGELPAPFARAKLSLLAGGRGTLCVPLPAVEPAFVPGCAVRPARSGVLPRAALPV